MTLPIMAPFATIAFIIATLFTFWQLLPGLAPFAPNLSSAPEVADALLARQHWHAAQLLPWRVGWWLWLVAIFSWMALLVTLAWSYLPAHRVAGVLQSGLMLIAAVLAIIGVNVWMALLPAALAPPEVDAERVALVDLLARTLVGAGIMMGGITTAWIAFDLIRHEHLPRPWLALLLASGASALVAGVLALNSVLLLLAVATWLLFCAWLGTRPALPPPFPTWKSG